MRSDIATNEGDGAMSRRVVFIGAAGDMCRVAIQRFAQADGDWKLELYDIRPEALDDLVATLPVGLATVGHLDLYDSSALASAIAGADLVVLGAGPYVRTAAPVMDACLAAGVDYLDYDDDIESTVYALSLRERAEAAGVSLYFGCGASPGMTNVMAVDAASTLDHVENIDLCWVMGDERPGSGRAVLEHMLSISAGPCLTWDNGGPVMHESYVETGTADMGGGLGHTLMYETAHPEAVTIPRKYPDAKRIRVLGGLDPAPYNGAVRGLALAVQRGRMTLTETLDFMEDVQNEKFGSLKGWRHAIRGVRAHLREGKIERRDTLRFLVLAMIGRAVPFRGGLLVRVTGLRDGVPTVEVRRTPNAGEHSALMTDMAAVTGSACAAFMVLALERDDSRVGAFAPEDWADPEDFYAALRRVGIPADDIVETPGHHPAPTAPQLTA
jgi:saccharopine dehydrogenase-like NADP-dependent oxidoreductase